MRLYMRTLAITHLVCIVATNLLPVVLPSKFASLLISCALSPSRPNPLTYNMHK